MSITSAADARSHAVSPAEMVLGIRTSRGESLGARGAGFSGGRGLGRFRFGHGDRRERVGDCRHDLVFAHMPLASPTTFPSGSANIAIVTGPVWVGLRTVLAPRASAFLSVPSRS